MLEQDCDHTIGNRVNRFWSVFTGTSAYLPLIMVNSGHQSSNGYVDFKTVYPTMIDAELARAPQADVRAWGRRVDDTLRIYTTITNRSGMTLSSANYAAVSALVWEDVKVGVTSRTVRAAPYSSLSQSIADGATLSLILNTPVLSGVDWTKLHALALIDYCATWDGPCDMLQAAVAVEPAITLEPDHLSFTVKGTDNDPSGTLAINGPAVATWTASSDSAWLSLSATSGALPTTATYSIVKSKLVGGSQEGHITFTGISTDGLSLTATLPVTVVYGNAPEAPAGVSAWATSSTRVSLSWTAASFASGYDIERRAAGGTFAPIGSSTTNAFTDPTASPDTAYQYHVRSKNSLGVSAWSAPDLATTVMFTDDPITAGATTIEAAHLMELRNATNAIRSLAGLTSASFTGSATAGTIMAAAHINEIRAALDAARGALTLSTGGYTDTIAAGTPVKAVHFQEIRNRMK